MNDFCFICMISSRPATITIWKACAAISEGGVSCPGGWMNSRPGTTFPSPGTWDVCFFLLTQGEKHGI